MWNAIIVNEGDPKKFYVVQILNYYEEERGAEVAFLNSHATHKLKDNTQGEPLRKALEARYLSVFFHPGKNEERLAETHPGGRYMPYTSVAYQSANNCNDLKQIRDPGNEIKYMFRLDAQGKIRRQHHVQILTALGAHEPPSVVFTDPQV